MTARKKRKPDLPSFRKPPVIEVVCGIKFEPLKDLRIPHIGLFWDNVRGEFPKCEHAPPLSFGPDVIDSATGLPVPRVWLIDSSDERLIQIQRDVFFYNWRKRENKKTYPRYKTIIRPFRKNFKLFKDFLGEHDIGNLNPTECELIYINHIPQGDSWHSSADFGKIFPDFNWRSSITRFLSLPSHITWRTSFPLPENKGFLNIKLEHGHRKIDEMPILVLELKANGLGADKSLNAIWKWFGLAHEWIVRGFADITGSSVQNTVWQRDDSLTG